MRHLILPLLLATPVHVWADTASTGNLRATDPTHSGWRRECLGRSQFEVPGDIEWHVAGGHWNYPEFGIYKPNIDPSDKQLSYGRSPFQQDGYLFDIEVSPKTTIDVFQQLKNRHGPDTEASQSRIIQEKIKTIREEMTWELEQSDPKKFDALTSERRELDRRLIHLGKLHSDVVMLSDTIKTFENSGRPTEKLKTEIEGYQKELATYPTDTLYDQERYLNWGIEDAQVTWSTGGLVALLWRDSRAYRFTVTQVDPSNGTSEALEELMSKAREVLAKFRPRAQFEIPQEKGFCLPFGFIADNGTTDYAITLAWHPVNNPNLLYSLSLGNDIDKANKLLPMLTSGLFTNPFPGGLEINRFGPEAVQIGANEGIMGAARYKGIDPDTGKNEAHERFTLTAGHANHDNAPSLVLKVESFANGQPLPFEQVKTDLLRTLKSIRPLPDTSKVSSNSTDGH